MNKMLKDKLIAAAAMLLAAALGFGLLAAAEGSVKSVYTPPQPEPVQAAAAPEPEPEPEVFVPELSYEETMRMCNIANLPLYAQDSYSRLIGRAYSGGRNALVRINAIACDMEALRPVDPDNEYPYLFYADQIDVDVLAYDCWLGNIQYDEESDTVYGLDVLRNGAFVAVKDGFVRELPVAVHTYCLDGGRVYYVDSDTMTLKSFVYEPPAEGSDADALPPIELRDELDVRMDCPFITGDWVICVSLDEGNGVWAYKLDGSESVCLVEESASCPIIDGSRLYYLSDSKGYICMKDLKTGETEEYGTLRTAYTFFLTKNYIALYDGDGEQGPVFVKRDYMRIEDVANGDPIYTRLDKDCVIGFASWSHDIYAGVELSDDGSAVKTFWERGFRPPSNSIYYLDIEKPNTVYRSVAD